MEISKDHLELLSKNFKNKNEVITEIINLEAILSLPKGTEHFISDIHGEYEAFDHILRNGSGVIKEKLKQIFGKELDPKKINLIATVIYYPEEKLRLLKKDFSAEEYTLFQKELILRLLKVLQVAARKYTRSKVRKTLPKDFSYIIEELIYKMEFNADKKEYYSKIIDSLFELECSEKFIAGISYSIQKFVVNHLHIVGDIYDRGPYPDRIMERLMNYHSVDIQWGNHDMLWIGACCGDLLCISNVLRICARYDNLDIVEDRYGIPLRGLMNFSEFYYGKDDCKEFLPKLADKEKYSEREVMQIARMQKAMAIIQFKLEKKFIEKHPEFNLSRRLLLDKIDYEHKTVKVGEKIYKLTSLYLPTVDKNDPYKLTKEEEVLVKKLRESFSTSEKLRRHIEFMINNGAMYKCYNDNLLIHGCMPVDEDGNPKGITYEGKTYYSKEVLDFFDKKVREIFFSNKKDGHGIFLYLWQGENSPLFGKKDMTTFERYFIADKESHVEEKNPYYKLREKEEYAKRLLKEFGLTGEGHIINGHTPIKSKNGEDAIKANGKTIVIDGGMSKPYNKTTGHGGYTLTYNSIGLQIMKHDIFSNKENAIKLETDIVSTKRVVDKNLKRKMIRDTDTGKEIIKQIEILKLLLSKYRSGEINEKAD